MSGTRRATGYLDLLGGIAVNALGHAHPALVEAVASQLSTLGHVSNFFATEPQVRLAETLLALLGLPTGGGKVFLSNSGTEANEAAFKLTRRTGRTQLVAMEGSFHGRTACGPGPDLEGRLPRALRAAARTRHLRALRRRGRARGRRHRRDRRRGRRAGQGEAGVVFPPAGFLNRAREITTEHGALLWVDEVQSGMGRTGSWFAHTESGVTPDVVTLAKGLGGGIPIGATVAVGGAGTLLGPGNHGTTFGGNPVAAAAALTVIATIESDGLLDNAVKVGEVLQEGLADPRVTEIRGRGLWIGLDLDEERAPGVVESAMHHGVILNACTPSRIRLAPPLVLGADQARSFTGVWPTILDEAYAAESP